MDDKRLWLSICGGRYKFRVEIVSVAAGATLRQRGALPGRRRISPARPELAMSYRGVTTGQGGTRPGQAKLSAGGRAAAWTDVDNAVQTHARPSSGVRSTLSSINCTVWRPDTPCACHRYSNVTASLRRYALSGKHGLKNK